MAARAAAGYHKQASGAALETVKAHSKDAELTLFGAAFCPFVQRTWIALEAVQVLPYRYFEIDPYAKQPELLEVSPRGLVPALRIQSGGSVRAIPESTVIAEYIEEVAEAKGAKSLLLPQSDHYARARARFLADHVHRKIVPAFYRYLQAQETSKQLEGATDFSEGIETLCQLLEKAAEEGLKRVAGLWLEDGEIGWVDMMVIPWLLRSENVLKHYRGWETPDFAGYRAWLGRLLAHKAVRDTTSTEDLYLDSYARYAENRPNTSQVADAINSGKGLP